MKYSLLLLVIVLSTSCHYNEKVEKENYRMEIRANYRDSLGKLFDLASHKGISSGLTAMGFLSTRKLDSAYYYIGKSHAYGELMDSIYNKMYH